MQRLSERDEPLVRYLLGDLSPEEAARLEEAYFADDESFEQLLAVEDELIHAYARGELTARERERFETHYLSHPRGRERTAFARDLVRALAPPAEARTRAPARRAGKPLRRRTLLPGYFAPRPALVSFAAVLLVALVAAGLWYAFERRARSRIEAEQAREQRERQLPPPSPQATPTREDTARVNTPTPAPAASPSPEINARPTPPREDQASSRPTPDANAARTPAPRNVPAVATLILSAGSVRGEGESRSLFIGPGTRAARLLVELPAGAGASASYRASVQSVEGREIWARGNLRARAAGGKKILPVQIPARLLPAGDYVLVINLMNDRGGVAEPGLPYSFKVKSR